MVALTKPEHGLREHETGLMAHAIFVAFTAQTRMSGVDLDAVDGAPARRVRKSAAAAVMKWCARVNHMTARQKTGTPQTAGDAAEEAVTDALLALSRVFVGLAARSMAQVDDDVTLSQFRSLVLLVSRGPLRVVDLAAELGVQSSTATRLAGRLVRKGLVRRLERPDDRRAVWLALTAAGRDLVGSVTLHRRAAIGALVRDLSMTRPLGFASVVHALVEAAGEPQTRQRWQQLEDAAAIDALPGRAAKEN